jgi:chromosome segregation ATPase
MNESLHNYHVNRNSHQHRDVSFHDYEKQDRCNNNNNNYEKGLEIQLENRLKSVYQKIKRQRDSTQSKNNMKIIIDEMSRQPSCENNNGPSNLNQMIADAEKNKAQAELLQAKKRLHELEESKHGLATEVQFLKEQLNKFDSASQCSIRQPHNDISNVHVAIPIHNMPTMQNVPHCLIKEIEFLKAELARATTAVGCGPKPVACDSSADVLKAIEKYEKQKDVLADHNQALKVLLKEKEKAEGQLQAEVQTLKDKNNQLEVGNCKLQADLDNLYLRFNELSNECEKYVGYLRSTEDQLSLSEKKRDELKTDAQETIKLWKNKVKKLEKSVDRYRNESEKLGEQNNGLIGNFNNLTQQIDSKNQEASVLRVCTNEQTN